MYIITYSYALENQKDFLMQIEPPAEWQAFFEASDNIGYHNYQIKYYRRNHEVACPRYRFADGTEVTVIPWFLIPGRPYPLQTYMYACGLYGSNPEIGQRGAAEATRAKYELETFSHSTVCRSFKSFEQARERALERKFGEEIKAGGTEAPPLVGPATKAGGGKAGAPHPAGRFPSAADTAGRREGVARFLPKYPCNAKIGDIESISRGFVENWHKKNRVLLI